MVFNSIQFLLFLPLVVLVYYLVPQRGKNLWLLFTSYYFYICWHPTHMVVLLFVTAVAYLGGRLVAAAAIRRRAGPGWRAASCWLSCRCSPSST